MKISMTGCSSKHKPNFEFKDGVCKNHEPGDVIKVKENDNFYIYISSEYWFSLKENRLISVNYLNLFCEVELCPNAVLLPFGLDGEQN